MGIRNKGIELWNWCFNNAIWITSISFLLLTIVDISNLNQSEINAFNIEKLQVGRIFYYFLVIITFIFVLFGIDKQITVQKLEDETRKNSHKVSALEDTLSQVVSENMELFNSYLKLLGQKLELSHTERISVYTMNIDKFQLIGRASNNPILAQSGRPSYSLGHGLISKGWEEQNFTILNLPSYDLNNGDDYYNAVNEIKLIGRDIVDNLKMKSRSYVIKSMNGYDGNPRAVIVFESLNENGLNEESINNQITEINAPLVMFIEKNSEVQLKNSKLANTLGL